LGISHLGEGAVPCTSHFCHSYPDADAIISRTYFNSRRRRRKKKEEERIRKKNREKVKFLTIFSSILPLFFFLVSSAGFLMSSSWVPLWVPEMTLLNPQRSEQRREDKTVSQPWVLKLGLQESEKGKKMKEE